MQYGLFYMFRAREASIMAVSTGFGYGLIQDQLPVLQVFVKSHRLW